MGYFYAKERRDPYKAEKYLSRARKQGHRDACFYLAGIYDGSVKDIPDDLIDKARGRQVYEDGAMRGNPECLTEVGIHTYDGDGCRQDKDLATHLFTLSPPIKAIPSVPITLPR